MVSPLLSERAGPHEVATFSRVKSCSLMVSFRNMCLINLKLQCCNISYEDNKDQLTRKCLIGATLSQCLIDNVI